MKEKKKKVSLDALIAKAKNDLLKEIVGHHHYCQHCEHRLINDVCLFAYDCVTNDFYFYYDDDE